VLGHLTGHRVDPAAQASFRAGWFTENLATQALAMLLLRSGGVRRRPARPVLVAALALLAVGVLLPLSPLAAPLGLGVLPVAWMPLLGAILAGFAGLVLAARLLLRQSRVFQ
jgi:Mg2+-importing ATPase